VRKLALVARRFAQNQVRREMRRLRSLRSALPARSLAFMCMRRGPNLKLLPLVLKAEDVVMMAILFSRGRPQPSVLGPRGRAPLLRLETAMMTTLTYLSMSRWQFPFTVLSAHGVIRLWLTS
jgi:hypothetical protein